MTGSPASEYQTTPMSPRVVHTNSNPETESFWDEIRTGQRFKECDHSYRKIEYLYPRSYLRSEWAVSTNVLVKRVTPAVLSQLDAMMPVPQYDWDALADQACAFMAPDVNEGLSVLNFAYELREMKSLDPRDAFRRIKYGSTALRYLRDKRTREGFIKDTIRRLAGAHLQAEFGLIPFVRDVVELHDELSLIDQKIRRLKQHAGRVLTRHYKRVLPYAAGQFWPKAHMEQQGPISLPNLSVTLGSTQPWYSTAYGVPGRESKTGTVAVAYLRKQWIQRPTYHATMRYSYTVPRFDTEWGEKLAFYTEALGIRLDPSIPWNAARFSFLVDWVVDVSGFLRSFARENYPLNTKVLDFCHSLKWHSQGYVDIKEPSVDITQAWRPLVFSDPYPLGYVHSPMECCYVVDNHYERWRANPSLFGLVSKRLDLRKAALAGSLMITNNRFFKSGRRRYLRLLPQTLRELREIRDQTSQKGSHRPSIRAK